MTKRAQKRAARAAHREESSLARAAQAVMAASPTEAHSLKALSGSLGVSPFHLAHVFSAEMGISLHRYLIQLRLAFALERLADGATSLSALALDAGFSSHSHFTTTFHRHLGMTPCEARAVLSQFN
jgi:AraC family transcriptional regulator